MQAEQRDQKEAKKDRFEDRVVCVKRVSKTVKGGRRMSFSALVVVGDKEGTVGYGFGKALEVPEAVRKAVAQARKNLINVTLENNTLPYAVDSKFGASLVWLSPATDGTGIVAGSAVRAIAELAGIPNLVSKIHGSRNPQNVVKATFKGLESLTTREKFVSVRKQAAEV